MDPESSSGEFLREVAERQGVVPSGDDLEAVLAFLDAILPELARIEQELAPDALP